jgi:hypothetical protein
VIHHRTIHPHPALSGGGVMLKDNPPMGRLTDLIQDIETADWLGYRVDSEFDFRFFQIIKIESLSDE